MCSGEDALGDHRQSRGPSRAGAARGGGAVPRLIFRCPTVGRLCHPCARNDRDPNLRCRPWNRKAERHGHREDCEHSPMTARPILHDYFRSSAAYRVRIALNLKGVDYESRQVNLVEGDQKSADYLTLNPQGLVPMLEIDGLKITQSLAIAVYL